MKFHQQELAGVYMIEPTPFVDDRGVFRRHFCQREFEANGITCRVAQCNVSENRFKGTLRGFHYQTAPHGEGKTLSCIVGRIYDIVVDLRPVSPTYLRWLPFELDAANRRSIHIPPGCANAFLTLEDNCLIHYYCSEFYCAQAERGIRYDDPSFRFHWPWPVEIISDKDRSHPDYVPAGDGSRQ